MGCCISTKRDSNPPNPPNDHHSISPTRSPTTNDNDRGPPPSVEEETVKEVLVLSETPIIITKPQPKPKPATQISITDQQEKTQNKDDDKTPELSQVSEICSITESFSTATTATTTTITEKKEDEAISKLHRVSRSPAKAPRKRPYTGSEIAGGARERASKSPARRTVPTPEKRVQVGPMSVRGRESGQVGTRSRNVGSIGVRRDSGEGPGRRSRSPATRTAGGVGRGSVGRSPLKATGAAGGRLANVAVGVEGGSGSKKDESNDAISEQGTESLENPLVSLECFIFL